MEEIIKQHGGKWGVYKHDVYKFDEKSKQNAFVDAFSYYKDALMLANKIDGSIHLIPLTY